MSARRTTSVPLALGTAAAVLIGVATTGATDAAYTAALSNPGTASTVGDYSRSALPFRDSFAGGQGAWRTYGGTWTTQTSAGYGTFTETSGSTDGPKAVTGDPAWTDYTMQADV